MRAFDNPYNLHVLIVLLRLRALDPLANAFVYQVTPDDGGPVHYYASIASTISDAAIQNLLGSDITADEQSRISDYAAAAGNFNNLPDWSTWTPTQATTYIHDNILSGQTQAQLDTWIDNNVTSFPGTRLALKQIGGSMLTIRSILENMAKAILYLRNLLIRLRD